MQRAQWLSAPRGRRRVPGGSASPGIGAGSLARTGAGERGMLPGGGGKTLFAEEPERFGGWPVFSPPGSPPHQGKGRRGERGCHPPPPRRAAREFLPRVPGPRGSPTKRGPGILSPCQHAHHHPRACSPITDSPAAAAGIHRAYGATEEGILPRRAGVIPGRPPTLPSSSSPLPRPGRARAGNQASGSVSAALGLCQCGSGKGPHTGCKAAEHWWLKEGRRSGLRSAGGSETELVLRVLGREQ